MSMLDLILAHAPRSAMARKLADVALPRVECFYFGYTRGAGHTFCTQRTQRDAYSLEREASAALGRGGLDTALCWNSPRCDRDRARHDRRDETEGRAFTTRRNGWTAVAFWDRSGDPRPACNTAFIVHGEMTFPQVIRAARVSWPQVWARFTFPVVEVDERGREVPR